MTYCLSYINFAVIELLSFFPVAASITDGWGSLCLKMKSFIISHKVTAVSPSYAHRKTEKSQRSESEGREGNWPPGNCSRTHILRVYGKQGQYQAELKEDHMRHLPYRNQRKAYRKERLSESGRTHYKKACHTF